MSFGITTFAQDTFGGSGGISVFVSAPSLEATTTVVSFSSITGSATFTLPSVAATTTVATSPTGVSVSSSGLVSYSSYEIVTAINGSGVSVVGTASFTLPSVLGTFTVNDLIISSDANVSITSGFEIVTTIIPFTSVVGNAVVLLDSVELVGSIGTLTFLGDANFTVPTVQGTTTLDNSFSVSGSAIVDLVSMAIQSTLNSDVVNSIYIYNYEDYSRERTVYVDYKDNYIRNSVWIEEQNRTVYVSDKLHLVSSAISVPEQNRTVYISEKQHNVQSRIAKAA